MHQLTIPVQKLQSHLLYKNYNHTYCTDFAFTDAACKVWASSKFSSLVEFPSLSDAADISILALKSKAVSALLSW